MLVKKGRKNLTTEPGLPIAPILPVGSKNDSMEDRLNSLEDSGILKRGTGQLKLPRPIALPGKAVSSLVIEERNERL